MEKPRNLAFDACKGLAIYAVVMIHVETVLTWRIPTETVAMPAFFFISGYFFSRYFLSSERGESKQFLKKCKRLFLPFLVWSCVALIFNLVLEILKNGGIIGFAEIVRTQSFDIFIHARSLWFLICLFYTFVFTLLCHCIGRMACPNSKYAGLIIAIIGYALLYLFVYDAADNSFLRFFKFQWLYPYFLFGCVIRREAIEGFLAFACNHRVAFLASALCVLGLMYVSYDREAYTLWCEPDARARGGGIVSNGLLFDRRCGDAFFVGDIGAVIENKASWSDLSGHRKVFSRCVCDAYVFCQSPADVSPWRIR